MQIPSLASLRLRPELIFESDHLSENLSSRTARGGFTNLIAQVCSFSVQTVSTILLARILLPDDYGLVAMVSVFIGLAAVFKDAGLSVATVQRDEISEAQLSTVFWINIALLLVVGGCVIAASPLVAAFYKRPELTGVTVALGLAFILNGLSVQHDALLRRHMLFRAVAVTQVLPIVLSLAASLALALWGWRYWALVTGTMVVAVTSTSLSFYFCPWRPKRIERRTGARSMLRFGLDLTGFNAANYFARNADNVLIGKFVGADALGLYGKAYSLFMLPIGQIRTPINDVAIPALSALKRQPARYRSYYLTVVGIVGLVTVPLALYCALEGDFLIRFLLGPNWAGAAPVFRILSVVGVLQTVSSTSGLVLITLGRTRRYMSQGLVTSGVTVAAFIVGLRYGIIGVAIAYAVVSFLMLLPVLAWCFHGTPVSVRNFLGGIWRPLAYGGTATLAGYLIGRLGSGHWLLDHTLEAVVFFGIYSLLVSRSRALRDVWRPITAAIGLEFGVQSGQPRR